MAQKVDLYTLLKTFSQKSYSAVISTETFIRFMERNVQRENAAALHIDDWKMDTRGKILRALNDLVVQNKVTVEGTAAGQTITLNSFYHDVVAHYYQATDGAASPFPSEESLRIKIPPTQVKTIPVESGLINYLHENHDNPNRIVRLLFPEGYGSGLTLEAHYPRKLLEYAIMKIEHHLHNRSEMEYFMQKLMIRFRGQEIRVRNFIDLLMTRPKECISHIEESSEFVYTIWLFLCPLIKKHIEEIVNRTNDRTPAFVALVQASIVVLTINNFYQIIAINKRNTEMALGTIYELMLEPPFIFTIADMLQFKGPAGTLLTERYTQLELENFLKEKMAIDDEGKYPELTRFKTREGLELFVRKEKIWPLCIKLLAEVQPQIKNEIIQRWMKTLREFGRDPAMDSDSAFEDLIEKSCNLFSPQLLLITQDKRLALLQDELLNAGNLPKDTRLFDIDRPIPLRTLLGLRRGDIIRNCKLTLPFWYSIGFIVKIAGIFRGTKNKSANSAANGKKSGGGGGISASLHASAEKLAKILVPEDKDIDGYLESVRDRWNQLLDKTAQKKLTDDVHAVAKAHLNQVLKFQKPNSFDNQMLDENADRIIKMNAALDRINNKNALRLYIKIYITKLLLAKK
ncbi:MAG: hypothetical protein LBD22_03160 [Spirochaetaceae bacterium]|jgi:hypothetical protein|nr:hypothetical protein [Spirochaetaceae bacterium]